MKYHLDRRVVLNAESKFQSLYKWSLQEVGADGQPIGRDLIPWEWSLYFEATELALYSSTELDSTHFSDAEDGEALVRQKRSINAKLRPAAGGNRLRTSYSMIGTDRRNVELSLFIQKLEDGDAKEHCRASGVVSYTTDFDFRDETFEDVVSFYLYVRGDTFDEYADMIVAGAVDGASLRVGRVAGFYSDWSPAISTGEIKVLTRGRDHSVELPVECDIDPPRLGKVGEAYFQLHKRLQLGGTMPETEDEASLPVHRAEHANAVPTANTDPRALTLLSSLRIAAWIIAALLVLLVFR